MQGYLENLIADAIKKSEEGSLFNLSAVVRKTKNGFEIMNEKLVISSEDLCTK